MHSRDKLITTKLNDNLIIRAGYGLQEESVEMLGVEIDENLDWKCYITAVTKKIGKGKYLIWRHGKILSINMKKVINESFLRVTCYMY